MLARLRKSTDEKDQGFTLIELLVVMIIIGILAAIAIPVFLNQQKKARDTATKSDVSTAGKEIANYFVDGAGTLTVSQTGTTLTITDSTTTPAPATPYTATVNLSKGTTLGTGVAGFTAAPTAANWCIGFSNSNGTSGQNSWRYRADTGLTSGVCP